MFHRLLSKSRQPGDSIQAVQNGNETEMDGKIILPELTVAKLDHHSVEFTWEGGPDSHYTGKNRLKYTLQEEDSHTGEFKNVYVGYAETYKIEGLNPLTCYTYCLTASNKSGKQATSPLLRINTEKEPYESKQLHYAVSREDIGKLEQIMASGDVDINTVDKIGNTSLMSAAQNDCYKSLCFLLSNGADVHAVNGSGRNSLMLGCLCGSMEIVKKLLEHGAKVQCSDKGGSTPLHWAVDGGNVDLVRYLIANGADIHAVDHSGWSSLSRCAAMSGDADIGAVLLQAGADPNIQDKKHKTPLMTAALNNHLELVKTLVKHKADVNLKTDHGKSAIEMAESFGRKRIVEFFLDHFQQ